MVHGKILGTMLRSGTHEPFILQGRFRNESYISVHKKQDKQLSRLCHKEEPTKGAKKDRLMRWQRGQ